MSSPQGRKAKPDSYAYSWFLPAEGHGGLQVVSQMPPPEPEATSLGPQNEQIAAMNARTDEWRHSGTARPQSVKRSLAPDSVTMRLAGVAGWSAMAGTGAFVLLERSGSFPGLQLGVLTGVWLGVSAAIWLLPGILSRLSARGR
ncbi:MAG TPA: hypothetical protein VLU91_05580 [Nitrososphaerales archaeon]|nr:hypothetical protein [Nitrososphaerales archaeon]